MAKLYTVDASVFVNAFNYAEVDYEISQAFLRRLHDQDRPILVPTLIFAEIAAGIARGRGDSELARNYVLEIAEFPHITTVAIDESLALESADLAARSRIRGCDAIYVAVAHRFGATLVTRDRQQRERAAGHVPVFTPAELVEDT